MFLRSFLMTRAGTYRRLMLSGAILLFAFQLFGQVTISEFMATGNTVLADEDGDHPDWIEIHNAGPAALNLDGWFLTDSQSQPQKWRIPPATVAANGNLIIFASGKDRTSPELHANFNLDADGEYLALVMPDGVTVASEFAPKYPQQYSGYSYGVVQGTNFYFATPSPGANNSPGLIARVEDTKFSVDRGFFTNAFNLVLTCATTNTTIRYTTNGSLPTLSSGILYSAPIRISRTSVIRAAAFRTGFIPSDTDTETYLFLADVIRQSPNGGAPAGWPSSWGGNSVDYGMDPNVVNNALYSGTIKDDLMAVPTLSIVTDLKNFFDPSSGIYANASQDGIEWERPASVELIRPDGGAGFQVNAGVRIRGGFSRDPSDPKHSLRFIFRSEYGDSKLRYPFFGPDADDTIDKFDLRTAQDNSWAYQGDAGATFLPDPFCRDTQLALGQAGTHGAFYHVYLDGQYWGVYNTEERPEAEFAASYFGGTPEDYDVIKVEAGPYDVVAGDGNLDAWFRLWQAATNGFASDAKYQFIQGNNPDGTPNPAYEVLLDVPNLIDYMLVIIYAGDFDGPVYLDNFPNNFYAMRSRVRRDGFRFVTHDAELSLNDVNFDRTDPITVGDPAAGSSFSESNPQYIWQRLQANAEFRMLVADHVQRFFFNGGPLTPAACAARFAARTNELNRAIVGESARWGDAKREPPLTRADWIGAVSDRMTGYFPQRSGIVLGQLRSRGLYPATAAPVFSQHGGLIPGGFNLSISVGSGTIYYTLDGTDPRLPGGATASGAIAYSGPVALSESVTVKARARAGTSWSALTEAAFYTPQDYSGLLITEIMYHPPDFAGRDGDAFEFIELKNASASQLDLSGVRFTNGIRYTFPVGSKLPAGGFAVLAGDATAFALKYTNVAIAGIFGGHLDNSGERIDLVSPAGSNLVSVTYGDRDPWPQTADGLGFSIVPVNPNLNLAPGSPANWRASSAVGGSPGSDDPPSNQSRILISEVLTHTDPPQLDSIELYNPGTNDALIGGWYLTDDRTRPLKFRIPDATMISAGGYRVFDEHDFNPAPGSSNNFTLSSHGDEVYLYSADLSGNLSGYSDGFGFGAAQNGVSFGRYVTSVGEIHYPAQKANTLGGPNAGPAVGPVVINEIRYAPAPDLDEFVELKNITANRVKLFDPLHSSNSWKVAGIDFRFPTGIEIEPNGLLIIARIDTNLFRAKYGVPASVPIFGPYSGGLQDGGETLELQRPDTPDLVTNGSVVSVFVPYITVDAVRYSDRAPWPAFVSGTGLSLERIDATAYGNDPVNWRSSPGLASPGFENTANRPPGVFAGLDQALSATIFPLQTDIGGSVTDDGMPNPPGAVKTAWSRVSGPGPVTFGDAAARSTTARFPGVGTYILRLSADDGELQGYSDLTVTIQLEPSQVMLVSTGSVWKYNDKGLNLGTNWRTFSYDDSTWASGPAELGYGDIAENRPEATVVSYGPNASAKYITTYFRRSFVISNAADFTDLTVNLMRDDGAAVYLNGTNIFVSNLPNTYDYLTRAPNSVGGSDEYAFYSTNVPARLLLEGTNVLAVEVHQTLPDSSDISFDLELTGHRLPVNRAPSVIAGADQTVDLTQFATLDGTVTDDGLPIPPGLLTNGWTQISGPGTASFENPVEVRSRIEFTEAGIYTLRLTGGDGVFTNSADVTITVTNGIGAWKNRYFNPTELATPSVSGDLADPDNDGHSNFEEYLAGTDPRDNQSVLRLETIAAADGEHLRFRAEAGKSYTVQYRDSLSIGSWLKLGDFPLSTNAQTREIPQPLSGTERYYRVTTPRAP